MGDALSVPFIVSCCRIMIDHFVSAFLTELCSPNSRCQTGFTDRGYRCVCDTGITGEFCETGYHIKAED